jgi:hypothetical protein
LFFVNSRARLFYCIKPTKAWWQTFVGLVHLHHNVAIVRAHRHSSQRDTPQLDMQLAHAVSAYQYGAVSINGLIKKRALRIILRAQRWRARRRGALMAPPKTGRRRPIETARLLA